MRAWIESIRRPRSGPRDQNKQEAGVGDGREHRARQQEEPRVGVEGGRIIVEREVELETMWIIGRIAYARKYLGYPGSFGEFISDCKILFFKRGWRLL